ncbi:fumarylacetoacetate hydrolase family protein [Amycolatopsis sp. NBC_01488]|uniref:fumarylacetoacetate hydrolase family protein n=1 Tax=Amycolatopsis sp. NBC_01488 TaxID=2903563 RepID=UPI002E2919BB|nr:fumarylacetoacetate hydrolase family protein [Amycolatopsis sp. NBC_01488]
MKIASIVTDEGPSLGIRDGDGSVIDVRSLDTETPADLRQVLELGPAALADIGERALAGGTRLGPEQVRFRPVIPHSQAVWCAALNYPAHVAEGNWEPPTRPPFFLRVAGSLCGHLEPIVQPTVSDRLDYEGELAVVVGRRARHVPPSEAYDVIAGYSCFNDGSVRDWQRHTAQITSGKNFAGTGAFGPWLTTRDEVADIDDVQLTTRLNGKVMQQTKIGEMIFGIPELIAYLSTISELLPGDVIVTGTPGGVGARQTPQVFMGPGDVVEVEIDQVGLLRNPVVREETP